MYLPLAAVGVGGLGDQLGGGIGTEHARQEHARSPEETPRHLTDEEMGLLERELLALPKQNKIYVPWSPAEVGREIARALSNPVSRCRLDSPAEELRSSLPPSDQ